MSRLLLAILSALSALAFAVPPVSADTKEQRQAQIAECKSGDDGVCTEIFERLRSECYAGDGGSCIGWEFIAKSVRGEDSDEYGQARLGYCRQGMSYKCKSGYDDYEDSNTDLAMLFAGEACMSGSYGSSKYCAIAGGADSSDPRDVRYAIATACAKGAGASVCADAAYQFYRDTGANNVITRDLAGQACVQNSAQGCQISAMSLASFGDAEAAKAANEKACELGRRRNCEMQAAEAAVEARANGSSSAGWGDYIKRWTAARTADYNACTSRYGVNGCYIYKRK